MENPESGSPAEGSPPVDGSPTNNQPTETPTVDQDAVKKANSEAAKHRTERNKALKREAAFRTMLEAHNIDTSHVTDQAVQGLEIKDGQVVSNFDYTPQKIVRTTGHSGSDATASAGPTGLTLDAINKMTPDEINKCWEDGTMQSFLKTHKG